MRFLILSIIFFSFLVTACSPKKVLKEGKVIYAIDYPNHKDNFFLYSILPKEMKLMFKNGQMHSSIDKANLSNHLFVDCNKKKVSAYFRYADEAFFVDLKQADINQMVSDQKQYSIQFTSDKDTIAGFNVKKAIATCKTDTKDKIDLWYTEEIQLNNSNWYNPFKEVPGFLLAYSIDRYGIRMEFKAKTIDGSPITTAQLKQPKIGKQIPYTEYNARLADLFKSFD